MCVCDSAPLRRRLAYTNAQSGAQGCETNVRHTSYRFAGFLDLQPAFGRRLRRTGRQNAPPAGQLQRISFHRHMCDWDVNPVGLLSRRLHVVPGGQWEGPVLSQRPSQQQLLGSDLPLRVQDVRCTLQEAEPKKHARHSL